jgi:hypothetical protein
MHIESDTAQLFHMSFRDARDCLDTIMQCDESGAINPMFDLGSKYVAWSGGTWAQVRQYVERGYEVGAKRLQRVLADVSAVNDHQAPPDTRYAVAGAYVDIGRYVSGEPECMVEFMPCTTQPIAHIAYNPALSRKVSTQDIELRGCAMLALVDALERADVQCTVSIVSAARNKDGSKHWVISRDIKQAGDPVEVERLAFELICPMALRRLTLQAFLLTRGKSWHDGKRRWSTKGPQICQAAGYPCPVPESIATKYDIIVNAMDLESVKTPQAVARWVQNIIEKFNERMQACV